MKDLHQIYYGIKLSSIMRGKWLVFDPTEIQINRRHKYYTYAVQK